MGDFVAPRAREEEQQDCLSRALILIFFDGIKQFFVLLDREETFAIYIRCEGNSFRGIRVDTRYFPLQCKIVCTTHNYYYSISSAGGIALFAHPPHDLLNFIALDFIHKS